MQSKEENERNLLKREKESKGKKNKIKRGEQKKNKREKDGSSYEDRCFHDVRTLCCSMQFPHSDKTTTDERH